MAVATGQFELTGWDEVAYEDDPAEVRITRAEVRQRFGGEVEGDGAATWVMAYRPDGTARFSGLQRVDGRIQKREGSFVLETVGDFDGQVAAWTAQVIPGSATRGLSGLQGTATFEAPHGAQASFSLEYEFGD